MNTTCACYIFSGYQLLCCCLVVSVLSCCWTKCFIPAVSFSPWEGCWVKSSYPVLELKKNELQIGYDLPKISEWETGGGVELELRCAGLPSLPAQALSVSPSLGQARQQRTSYSGRSPRCSWDPDLGMTPASPGLLLLMGGQADLPQVSLGTWVPKSAIFFWGLWKAVLVVAQLPGCFKIEAMPGKPGCPLWDTHGRVGGREDSCAESTDLPEPVHCFVSIPEIQSKPFSWAASSGEKVWGRRVARLLMVLPHVLVFRAALASSWGSFFSWSPEVGRVAFALISGWSDAPLIGWPSSALADCLEWC